ncbi:hypothetical protein BH10BDE1_BH10BDE1_27510 [soil metagenome]
MAKKTVSKKRSATPHVDASKLIDGRIKELKDWRGVTLAKMREVILHGRDV